MKFAEKILISCSIIAGIFLNHLNWGVKGGFSGVGWPFPVVIWDNGRDYVSLLGYALNPIIMLAFCILLLVINRLFLRFLKLLARVLNR